MSMWKYVALGVVIAFTLLTLTKVQPAEVQHREGPRPLDATLATEIKQLRSLLVEQQAASHRQAELVAQLKRELAGMPSGSSVTSSSSSAPAAGDAEGDDDDDEQDEEPQPVEGAAVVAAAAAREAATAAQVAAAEARALSHCTEADVPLLRLMRDPCRPGFHGYDCAERWGLNEHFLPDPKQWLKEWNATARAVTNCQRGFFDAFAHRLTKAHWDVEWDAQPFRISAVPPRTIGKMIHQIITANYFHLTLGPRNRPPLRRMPLPGWNYMKTTQPGFRWNVLDYGKDNVFADPLSAGSRCAGNNGGWHCVWQRFPQQTSPRTPPPLSSPLGKAADALYNLSMAGDAERSLVQYLIVAGVTQVFSEPTSATRQYLREHLKLLCHVPGPHCGGSFDAMHTPVAAIHVRRGDSCDRERDEPGPFNSMFAWDKNKGKLDRVGFRYCYTWRVYLEQLKQLQAKYGVRTVLLATDDADGTVTGRLAQEKGFNWGFLHYPRGQFKKRGWMEFRKDLTDDVPFSLAAALDLLGAADVLVGNMGSHVTRMIYNKMIASSSTGVLPPFYSVDGYGLCCDFTEECAKRDIRERRRPVRDCIHKYGQCTGGDQFFRWGG